MGGYRKFIFICTGSDCKECGSKKLGGEVKELAASPAYQGKYKIIKTKCMDFCKSSPVIIYRDEVLKKATLEKLKEILD